MRARTRHVLRYVCPAAAVYLAAMQVCTSFLEVREDVSGPDSATCRALFTVTDVPRRHAANISLLIQDLQGHSPLHKLTGDWRERTIAGSGAGGADGAMTVAEAIRNLLLKRDSPSGASTANYFPLAALLPSVLPRQAGGESSAATATTRIGAAGGLLPYVPCQIATYSDSASVTACFRKRLAIDDSLWIVFMGDSKIRNLYYEFIARSDGDLHYSIDFQGGNITVPELRKQLKLKKDIDASSVKLQGLRVSCRFREFSEFLTSSERSREVQQLERWAAGQEAPPHLLVLGYSSWAMKNMDVLFFQDALVSLIETQKVVAPLLHQLSYRTRVIVTTQSRFKVHGISMPLSNVFGDPAFEWSEAVLLHLLRQLVRQSSDAPSRKTTREGMTRGAQGLRDHLMPGAASGVWWWDTNLPLSLAENSECEELFHSGQSLHPLYSRSSLWCVDNIHAGTITLGDMATMLLNLMCNSVVGGREGLCCA